MHHPRLLRPALQKPGVLWRCGRAFTGQAGWRTFKLSAGSNEHNDKFHHWHLGSDAGMAIQLEDMKIFWCLVRKSMDNLAMRQVWDGGDIVANLRPENGVKEVSQALLSLSSSLPASGPHGCTQIWTFWGHKAPCNGPQIPPLRVIQTVFKHRRKAAVADTRLMELSCMYTVQDRHEGLIFKELTTLCAGLPRRTAQQTESLLWCASWLQVQDSKVCLSPVSVCGRFGAPG